MEEDERIAEKRQQLRAKEHFLIGWLFNDGTHAIQQFAVKIIPLPSWNRAQHKNLARKSRLILLTLRAIDLM